MCPYWQRNDRRFPKCNHSEYLRTVRIREEKGQGKRLFERTPIPTAAIPPSLLVGGDFNSVLTTLEATGHPNYIRALQEFIRGFDLVENVGDVPGARYLYPLHQSGSLEIDRIYASGNLSRHKGGAETRVAAFTDHLAVVIRIALEATTMRHGRSYWKMNTALLREESFQEHSRQRWAEWSKQTKNYPTMVMWWEQVAKMHIKKLHSLRGCEATRGNTDGKLLLRLSL